MISKRKYQKTPYINAILDAKREWEKELEPLRNSDKISMTISRFLTELERS